MMFGLVHLPILLQYFIDFIAEGNVFMTNDADQDMQKDDILRIFEFLILVLEQFAVLSVDLAK